MARPELAWLTTTLADRSGLEHLRLDVVGRLATTADRITVVAAYWDHIFLDQLLSAIPSTRRNRVTFNVLVNGFTGQRGADDSERLSGILRKWRKRGLRRLSIGLVTGSRLFHSKLLVFERPRLVNALVGSANATEAAFTDNEELMLMLRTSHVPNGLREYLDAVAKASAPLDQLARYEARTFPAFFRGGDIYFRPVIVTSFRFDLRLPLAMRHAMTRLREPIAGITARAGRTYDPFAKIGLTPKEEQELTQATAREEGEAIRGRVPLRNYGIQTCYGWWVPNAYKESVENKLAPARIRRAVLFNRLIRLLNEKKDIIRGAAVDRFHQLDAYASREHFVLSESPEVRMRRFDALLKRAQGRLADPRWRQRAEEPYMHVAVPEIWSDPVSAKEFIDSCFDYLEFIATTKKHPRIWRSLRSRIASLENASSSDEIREAMRNHLSQHGWRTDDWVMESAGNIRS